MSDVPTFGWRYYSWRKPYGRHAVRCCMPTCRRPIYSGVIDHRSAGRELEPDFVAMCRTCYDDLDKGAPSEADLPDIPLSDVRYYGGRAAEEGRVAYLRRRARERLSRVRRPRAPLPRGEQGGPRVEAPE